MRDALHIIRWTSYAVYSHILPMISSSTFIAVVAVHVLLCATVVPSGAHIWISSLISKYFEAIDNLQCKWSWRKPCFPGKNTPVWCPSWDPGPESSVSGSGKSQWSGSLLQKSMENHVESGESEIESKSILVILIVFASGAVCKDKVINFCNTGITADGSRKR